MVSSENFTEFYGNSDGYEREITQFLLDISSSLCSSHLSNLTFQTVLRICGIKTLKMNAYSKTDLMGSKDQQNDDREQC